MRSIGEFFQGELKGEAFSPALLAGEIEELAVNREDQSVRVSVRFSNFVEYGELQRLSEQLQGPGLRRLRFSPCFPAESFGADKLEALAAALKEEDASLNGTLRQARAKLAENLRLPLPMEDMNCLLPEIPQEKWQG